MICSLDVLNIKMSTDMRYKTYYHRKESLLTDLDDRVNKDRDKAIVGIM